MSARLAIVASHPIQYYAPLFRRLAQREPLHVFYAYDATPQDQARAGFGTPFRWDVDLTSDYDHSFLANVADEPGTDRFSGCDTPGIGTHLREGGFDAALVLGWHLKAYVQAIRAAKHLRLPVLVRGDSHLDTPRSPIKRAAKALAYPPLLRLLDAALYVGDRSRAYYEHYRYPRERLFHSPHCVDNDWFAARATPGARAELRARIGVAPHTSLLLLAGKLMALKRPLDLVAAARLSRARGGDVEIVVAGDGELSADLVTAARNAHVPLHLLGFRNQSEMPAAYAAADALVLASESETWGLVANEALACGRPVIVSDACGCASDLAGSRAARIFRCADPQDLARAIDSVLADPPAPEALADAARRFSLEAGADGIVSALSYARRRGG